MRKNRTLLIILIIASFLRLWRLSEIPVSLFGDELDVGYHAYSILKTGRDYSGNFMPLHFQSLAEWRTPLYLYSAVPSVALFGISALGVRLPAAIFGVLGVWAMYLLVREFGNKKLAIIAAAVLAFSPWHIQYSRAGFEVTQLIFFLLMGLYLFFNNLKSGNKMWLSATFFVLMPWIYSTAKLFTPLLLVFLFITWRKEILILPKKHLVRALVALLIIGLPIAYSTVFGGGTERFGYVSVMSDPTTEPEVGTDRLNDARMRGELGEGLQPTFVDRALHNKFTFWGENILNNYFQPFSSEFLFNRGDPNLRHSIDGMGQFYHVEAIALILGLIMFFSKFGDRRVKHLIIFWILVGVVPAAITRDGGNHATRLILILPPLVILVAYGLYKLRNVSKFVVFGYLGLFFLNFIFYQHKYWVHNPWYSERWWHAGYGEAIKEIKKIEGNYDRIVLSMMGEPAWIFFAGHYEYPPSQWHKEFPIGNDIELPGFGKVSHIDKFYFGMPETGSLYDWGKVMDSKTLYLATAKEVSVNLILEPERTPGDLNLIKAIAYPSGEPALYLFSGK